jgi:hypothetical protein
VEKEVRIFDTKNSVLTVKGIRFELFNVRSGALLAAQNSDDLNPAAPGSNEWGVKLSFSPNSGPLDVHTSDPNHAYPGNTIRNLEGQNTNRIDIDLCAVPASVGGQGANFTLLTPVRVGRWVAAAPNWTEDEKIGVLNLIFNFARLAAQRELMEHKTHIDELLLNWTKELEKLGVLVESESSLER